MHRRIVALLGLSLVIGVPLAPAQEIQWRPANPRPEPSAAPQAIMLGRPQSVLPTPVSAPSTPPQTGYVTLRPPTVIRGQAPDGPPPPPPFPGSGPASPAAVGPIPGEEAFNCGIANAKPGETGFFGRFCDNIKKGLGDVGNSAGGIFQPSSGGGMFRSDDKFNGFISPVSNPFYFEDPRALTEVRPLIIWQNTPSSNPIFSSSNNFFVGAQGRVAFTEHISLVINKFGAIWADPTAPGFASESGFAELHLGPKFTLIRNDTSNTLLAVGLTFELPTGPSAVFQDTGTLSLVPYVSFGQNFGRSQWGSFNFLNTTGYVARVDSTRTDNLFSSFHLDYDVGNLKKIYPLIELNFAHYTFNGSARSFGFEGRDMFNFGSDGTAGHNELTLALGARYKFSEAVQLGLTGEFSLLSGGRYMDQFRLTFDVIFRY